MSSNVVDIKNSDILKKADPESRFYGALLNWKGDDGLWHYGIVLSDRYIFNTGKRSPLFLSFSFMRRVARNKGTNSLKVNAQTQDQPE